MRIARAYDPLSGAGLSKALHFAPLAAQAIAAALAQNHDAVKRDFSTRKPKLGSTPAPGVAGRASRPALSRATFAASWELFGAIEVFREGAENRTRGACAPHLNFGFRVKPTSSNAWPNTPKSNAGRPRLSGSAATPGQPN